jgi:hypothetical protein
MTMSYQVRGDYFESCTCKVSCPCIWLEPATEEACDVFFAWRIREGEMDGLRLDGLKVALAAHSPKNMTEGGWKVALYLDEQATADQAKALGAIFSGQAGGHLANVAPLIGTVTGVHSAPIEFDSTDGGRSVTVGEVMSVEVEQLKGLDGGAGVIANAPLGAVTQPLLQARAEKLSYRGDWNVSASGSNGFITEFEYSS